MMTQMIIRIPDDLKAEVSKLAASEGKNVGAIARDLLENFVKNKKMAPHVNDLWKRIGDKMQANGAKPADIDCAIGEARMSKSPDLSEAAIMHTVTVSPQFQIVIPRPIRESLHLRPGQKMQVIAYEGRIEFIPERDITELRGFLKGSKTEFERENDRA